MTVFPPDTRDLLAQTRWFHVPRPERLPALRVFCLPYSGGSASAYHAWAQYMPSGVELCALRLPGRASRYDEAPYTEADALLRDLLQAIRPWLNVPFLVFGHSMGALLGYELARRLEKEDRPARGLVVSGVNPPGSAVVQTQLHRLPAAELFKRLLEVGGPPPVLADNLATWEELAGPLRADLRMIETAHFEASPRVLADLHGFIGAQDPWTTRAAFNGWGHLTDGAFSIEEFPGSHFFIRTAREKVLDKLACIAREAIAADS